MFPDSRAQTSTSLPLLFGGVLVFVISIILLFNVALSQFNTQIVTNTPIYNVSNTAQCLQYCNAANLSGYAGAGAITGSSYVLVALSVLAAAAGLVFLLFKSGE